MSRKSIFRYRKGIIGYGLGVAAMSATLLFISEHYTHRTADDSAGRGPASIGAVQDCPDAFLRSGLLQGSQIKTRKGCIVSVHPEKTDVPYRRIQVTQEGMIMVFNDFGIRGYGAYGSRVYFLFPRRESMPSIEQLTNGDLQVRTTSGEIIRFSSETARISSMSSVEFTESGEISRTNRGGLEILRYERGIVLDSGYTEAQTPAFWNPNGKSTFRDPDGNTCPVINAKIFVKRDDEYWFKFNDDATLAQFLKKECPKLDTGWLTHAAGDSPSGPVVPPSDASAGEPLSAGAGY